jgi:4'-phosphopantetheinyl transferase
LILLDRDEVHVWCQWTHNTSAEQIERAGEVLSAEERKQRDRFRMPSDRRDYTLAHNLLRRSLSRYAATRPEGWEFVREMDGKPRLHPAALSFNLTHSRDLVACAIARAMPLGIDVERTDRLIEVAQLATQFFSASEAASLRRAQGDQRNRFFDLWTLKEAFVKAIGLGLSQPLNMFSFVVDGDDSHIRFEAPQGYNGFEWQFALYAPAADARLAVAAHAPMHTVHWGARETHLDGEAEMKPVRTSADR